MNHPERPIAVEPAYHNQVFLDSDDGRPLRILAEYLEPLYRLRREGIHDTIVFFRICQNEGRRVARTVLQRCALVGAAFDRMVTQSF